MAHDIKADILQVNEILSNEVESILVRNNLSYDTDKILGALDLVNRSFVESLIGSLVVTSGSSDPDNADGNDNDIYIKYADPLLSFWQKISGVWTKVVEVSMTSVIGLWDDRGSFNASGGAYPSTGGSGTSGAILKGDIWTISVAGTLPTGQVVEVGDVVRALVDTPGNTQANWAILQNNIGYVAENSANKDTDGTLSANSDIKYPSQKAVKAYVDDTVAASTLPAATPTEINAGLNDDKYVGPAGLNDSNYLDNTNRKLYAEAIRVPGSPDTYSVDFTPTALDANGDLIDKQILYIRFPYLSGFNGTYVVINGSDPLIICGRMGYQLLPPIMKDTTCICSVDLNAGGTPPIGQKLVILNQVDVVSEGPYLGDFVRSTEGILNWDAFYNSSTNTYNVTSPYFTGASSPYLYDGLVLFINVDIANDDVDPILYSANGGGSSTPASAILYKDLYGTSIEAGELIPGIYPVIYRDIVTTGNATGFILLSQIPMPIVFPNQKYNLVIGVNTTTPTGVLAGPDNFYDALIGDNPDLSVNSWQQVGLFIYINVTGFSKISSNLFASNYEVTYINDLWGQIKDSGSYVFADAGNFEEAVLPGLINIGDGLFSSAVNVKSISLPSATNYGTGAFGDCPLLTFLTSLRNSADIAQVTLDNSFRANILDRTTLVLEYREISAATTVVATDYTINVTSGTFTQPLPTIELTPKQIFNIKNSGAGVVTITATSINSGSSITANPGENKVIQYTGVSGTYITL